jgi:hypothetical protein
MGLGNNEWLGLIVFLCRMPADDLIFAMEGYSDDEQEEPTLLFAGRQESGCGNLLADTARPPAAPSVTYPVPGSIHFPTTPPVIAPLDPETPPHASLDEASLGVPSEIMSAPIRAKSCASVIEVTDSDDDESTVASTQDNKPYNDVVQHHCQHHNEIFDLCLECKSAAEMIRALRARQTITDAEKYVLSQQVLRFFTKLRELKWHARNICRADNFCRDCYEVGYPAYADALNGVITQHIDTFEDLRETAEEWRVARELAY